MVWADEAFYSVKKVLYVSSRKARLWNVFVALFEEKLLYKRRLLMEMERIRWNISFWFMHYKIKMLIKKYKDLVDIHF